MRFPEPESKSDDCPNDIRIWKMRATLLRVKTKDLVIPIQPYEKIIRGKRLDPNRPPALPYICDGEECETCFEQFFPLSRK